MLHGIASRCDTDSSLLGITAANCKGLNRESQPSSELSVLFAYGEYKPAFGGRTESLLLGKCKLY